MLRTMSVGTYVVEVDTRVVAQGADGRQFHQTVIVAAFHLLSAGEPTTSEISASTRQLAAANVRPQTITSQPLRPTQPPTLTGTGNEY